MNGNGPHCNRISPRFKTNFAARVETEHFCIPASITNVSSSGLQFECEHKTLFILMPNINRRDAHRPIQFHVRFKTPGLDKTLKDIDLICSVIYTRRINQQTAIVGCEFNSFEGDSEKNLLEYITHFGSTFSS